MSTEPERPVRRPAAPAPAAGAPADTAGGGRLVPWVLPAIVALGLVVRLWGLQFGLPMVRTRPDELLVHGVVFKMFDGNLNPRFFDYPALFLYLLAAVFAVYIGAGRLAGWFPPSLDAMAIFRLRWEPFFLMARTTSALMGTATVALCHWTAAPLFGHAAGLLSALFMALAFLHVRDSHYGTTDVPMAFFMMWAMVALVRAHLWRKRRDAWIAGVLAGLAAATKYVAGLLVLPLVVVELLHAWARRGDPGRALRETHLVRMGVGFTLAFLAANPYLVLDWQQALQGLRDLQASTASGMTPPEVLGRGWTYHLPFSLRHGLGVPLLAAGIGGLCWAAWRRPAVALILGSFPVAYYVVAGAGYNVFVRYMIPVVPFLCIFAGHAVAELAGAVARRTRVPAGLAAAALGLVVVAPSAHSVVRFDRLMAIEDSRLVAARWIQEHVPAGSTLFFAGNYGQIEIDRPALPPKYRYFRYDRRADRFTERDQPVDALPDVIVLQRSALPYSYIPPALERLVAAEYVLAHTVRAVNLSAANVYDVQDAFYGPYGGFEDVERPGPNLEIYRRP